MADRASLEGTAAWLREQWSNPRDIFTILLITGGDVVQVAIAQLAAGPVPYLVPVSFSFGWGTYAISALRTAVGENRLMPRPELDCILINCETGYVRANHSWVLSRMLRDFDAWCPKVSNDVKAARLASLRRDLEASRMELQDLRDGVVSAPEKVRAVESLRGLAKLEDVRVALRVTVWQCKPTTGRGSGDTVYWIGLVVSSIQLGLAAVPWALYGVWHTFLVTMAGTFLAYASSALPQWTDEKVLERRLKRPKGIFLTEGNGADDVVMILGREGDMDLEALAVPRRVASKLWTARMLNMLLAVLWVAFLITVSGWEQHTWYLLGVGTIGTLHNVTVSGLKRQPRAWGIDLLYKDTIVDGKVMEVLHRLEQMYPKAGLSLIAEFFPGELFPREERLWSYARRRHRVWREQKSPVTKDGVATAWAMPPLRRPLGVESDEDVPEHGPYDNAGHPNNSEQLLEGKCPVLEAFRCTGDAIIGIPSLQ